MGTRSYIGIEKANGTVDAVYCHFDGYIEGVGRTLFANYTTFRKTEKLIKGGSMSSLGNTAEHTSYYNKSGSEEAENDVENYSKEELFQVFEKVGIEYFYLYSNGVWYVAQNEKDGWKRLDTYFDSLDIEEGEYIGYDRLNADEKIKVHTQIALEVAKKYGEKSPDLLTESFVSAYAKDCRYWYEDGTLKYEQESPFCI